MLNLSLCIKKEMKYVVVYFHCITERKDGHVFKALG